LLHGNKEWHFGGIISTLKTHFPRIRDAQQTHAIFPRNPLFIKQKSLQTLMFTGF